MMGDGEAGYADYYNYDNSWSIIPPDYGAEPSCQYRQPQVEEDYRYGTYAVYVGMRRKSVYRFVGFGCVSYAYRPSGSESPEYHRARNPSAASSPMPSWNP
ncbi:jg25612 [Pararge aegeria aegeria]|uniref:Jg25612 protein n=1 Tax=Pararge aegeria aegeria TaxID=348720 RepID=A0A8S4RB44_9NEOP|nr:jg25612 [Pararge aegeria aegeria]